MIEISKLLTFPVFRINVKGSEKMIDIKGAAKIAHEYFLDIYSEAGYINIALEELDFSEDGRFWLVTIGYSISGITDLLGTSMRNYKIFEINKETGEVESMKIRKV